MTIIPSNVFKIKKKLSDFYPPGTKTEDIISPDENLMNTVPSLTDEELIEEVMNGSNDGHEKDDDGDAVLGPVCPKASDVRDALQVLRDYILHS